MADILVSAAFDHLDTMRLPGISSGSILTVESIGDKGICSEATDALTRAAYDMGIEASREFHSGGHFVTSFAALDTPPSEDDVIMCLTWGQFNPEAYARNPEPFFGIRKDIARLVGQEAYDECFSPESIELRQTTNTTPRAPWMENVWLSTTPEDIAAGTYPVGTVQPDEYPFDSWQYPGLVMAPQLTTAGV